MPQRLALETARLIADCKSDEQMRDTALHAFRTAAEYGFNHGNTEFMEALCSQLTTMAAAETDAARKQRLLDAVGTVCDLAAQLNEATDRPSHPE